MYSEAELTAFHKLCGWHEDAVRASTQCGCFDCLRLFPASGISQWIEEQETSARGRGRTAVCPACGMDTVLPESPDYVLSVELLSAMHKRWLDEPESDEDA